MSVLGWLKRMKHARALRQAQLATQSHDLDFVQNCTSSILLEHNRVPSLIIYIVLLFLIAFLAWASWAKIDRVTLAEGKVIPSSQVQIIEELFDGVVKKILVKKGQVVKKNEILLVLDDIHAAADYKQAQAKHQAIIATIARLKAQSHELSEVIYPAFIKLYRADLMARENELFQQRRQALASTLAILNRSYTLAQDELAIIKPLVKQGVTSQVELLRIEREVNQLKGEIAKAKHEHRDQSLSKLNQLQAEDEALLEAMASLKNKMHRTAIKSPVDGVIKKVNVHTIGAVVKSGMDIIEIVPLEDSLLIEAHVKPADIGFIRHAQTAIVKLTAFDYTIYGGLEGKVEYISPDTITDERKDKSYYIVTIRTSVSRCSGCASAVVTPQRRSL